jgi:hypothetical protein
MLLSMIIERDTMAEDDAHEQLQHKLVGQKCSVSNLENKTGCRVLSLLSPHFDAAVLRYTRQLLAVCNIR